LATRISGELKRLKKIIGFSSTSDCLDLLGRRMMVRV